MSRDGITFAGWQIPESQLEETFDTAGGPGGQHANRNRTAVTIRFDVEGSDLPDDLKRRLRSALGKPYAEATSSDSRSQWRNRALARQRLSAVLTEAARVEKKRKKTRPSFSSKQRRLEQKRRRSEKKRQRRAPDEW
jgi:ribosome-associated protein